MTETRSDRPERCLENFSRGSGRTIYMNAEFIRATAPIEKVKVEFTAKEFWDLLCLVRSCKAADGHNVESEFFSPEGLRGEMTFARERMVDRICEIGEHFPRPK